MALGRGAAAQPWGPQRGRGWAWVVGGNAGWWVGVVVGAEGELLCYGSTLTLFTGCAYLMGTWQNPVVIILLPPLHVTSASHRHEAFRVLLTCRRCCLQSQRMTGEYFSLQCYLHCQFVRLWDEDGAIADDGRQTAPLGDTSQPFLSCGSENQLLFMSPPSLKVCDLLQPVLI